MTAELHGRTLRWQRMGLVHHAGEELISGIQCCLQWQGRYVDLIGPSTAQSPSLPSHYGRREDLFRYLEMLQVQHLEFPHPFDETGVAVAMSQLAVDFFCGTWRDRAEHHGMVLDRAACRKEFGWLDEFRVGLVAALLAGRPNDARQIAEYVGRDLADESGAWDRTKDDCLFYVILASFLRDGGFAECEDLVANAQRARPRRPRMLMACLKSLQEQQLDRFTDTISMCLKLFRDVELDLDQGKIVTCVDATILWNLAESMGIALTPLPTELMDFVITRASLKLDRTPIEGHTAT